MKKLKFIIPVLMTLLLVYSCQNSPQAAQDENSANQTEERVFNVKTMKISQREIAKTVEYSANLQAFEINNIATASPGRITNIFVEIGDHVKKGQKLVQMDKTQLNQALLQYQAVKKDFGRLDTLHAVGGVSEQVYDQTKTQYDVAETNLEFLKENTTLLSPLNGIVTAKYFENGELYSGAPNTAAGKAAIVVVEQINPLKAFVEISEQYFPVVKQGMSVDLMSDTYPDTVFQGKVYKVYPTINPANRSFTVEVKVPNYSEMLRPGMFSRVSVNLGRTNAFIVPTIAVLKQKGAEERFVFVNEQGKAKRIIVKLGKRYDSEVEIISDQLTEGAELVVSGQAKLMNKDEIVVVN